MPINNQGEVEILLMLSLWYFKKNISMLVIIEISTPQLISPGYVHIYMTSPSLPPPWQHSERGEVQVIYI
jgi:hypothetical protein